MRVEIIRQSKTCPENYAKFLERVGGMNPYGEPNFLLQWGPSTTEFIWGQMDGGSCGQHVKLKYGPDPIWHLSMWKPPEMCGLSPEEWYRQSYDPVSGLHCCGDYPFRGYYSHNRRLNQLNYRILEELIPKIDAARGMTFEQRKRQILAEMEAEKRESRRIIADAYRNATPAFGGVAGTYESNRERWTRKYQHKMTAAEAMARLRSRIDHALWAKRNPQLSQEEINRRVIQGA
jgi:hypothetical protein